MESKPTEFGQDQAAQNQTYSQTTQNSQFAGTPNAEATIADHNAFSNTGTTSPSPFQPFGANSAQNTAMGPPKLRLPKFFARTRAYVPEYGLLLIVTGSVIGLVNALFSSSISYIGQPKPKALWGGGWQYTYSLSLLASTLVLIPALVFLTKRIKGSESDDPNVKNISWRKGFLGFFLVVMGLTILCYSTAFVYQVVSQIAGAGLVNAQKGLWKNYVRDIFAILLFGITAWLYSTDYRYVGESDSSRKILAKVHRYGLTVLAIVLAILFSSTALSAQRNDFIDNLITDDLNTIHSKIDSYESQKNRKVSSLGDLKLSDETTSRIKKYDYEYNKTSSGYNLCAVFKTDTSEDKPDEGDSTGLEGALNRSYNDSSYYSPERPDPSVHDKGRVCFKYTSQVYNYNQYDDSVYDYPVN